MYTLLIADDEHLECDAIELLVHRATLPLRIIKAKNGFEAVDLADRHKPEIVFLDIRMPGMDGIEAAHLIRERHSECHIVFLTAWSTFEFAQQAIRVNASEYLVKPVQSKEVYDLLDRLITTLDQRRQEEADQSNQMRQVLNIFSREFFAALKYGRVSQEAMERYFSFHNIREHQGVALVLKGIDDGHLERLLRPLRAQACYFPSPDRTTVLLFTTQGSKIIEQLPREDGGMTSIGTGVPFAALDEIPNAISTASIAFNWAQQNHLGLQRYSDVLLQPLDQLHTHSLIARMLALTLDGSAQQARTVAHQLIDTLLSSQGSEEATEPLRELVSLYAYDISKNIELLEVSPVPKGSVMEVEIYLMDLIDLASLAILTDRRDRYERPFAYVRQYIDEHLNMPLSLEDVALLVGINTKYFSKLCKSYLGSTFVEYVNTKKMERAHQLLSDGAATVKEVAEATGFSDTNYFSRLFRQHWGLSPSSLKE